MKNLPSMKQRHYAEARAFGCEIKDYDLYRLQRSRATIRKWVTGISLCLTYFILGALYVLLELGKALMR